METKPNLEENAVSVDGDGKIFPLCESGERMKLVEMPEKGVYAYVDNCEYEDCKTSHVSLIARK